MPCRSRGDPVHRNKISLPIPDFVKLAPSLLWWFRGHGFRIALEHFDWKAVTARRKKSRKSWDAITQLIRYTDVVGRKIPVSAQSIQSGELFVEPQRLSDKP
jgi:hypothetical protein